MHTHVYIYMNKYGSPRSLTASGFPCCFWPMLPASIHPPLSDITLYNTI